VSSPAPRCLQSSVANANRFLREVSLHVSGTGWRAYDDFIGQPIFYSGFSEQMISSVLATPILQSRIQSLASKRLAIEEQQGVFRDDESRKGQRRQEIEQSLQELCEKWTGDMICKMESKSFIRGAYYLCTQLLTRAYHQGESQNGQGSDKSS